MEGFCLKCSKDIADKRKGTLYCSVSCREATWQKAKRVSAKQAESTQMDWAQLTKLMDRGTYLIQNFGVCKQMDEFTASDEIPELTKCKAELAEWCRMMGSHPVLRPRKKK